jgi:hypothetical protein
MKIRALTAAVLFSCAPLLGQDAPRLRFGGFADVTFDHSTRTHHDAFAAGELDLYASAVLSNDWSALAEGFVQHAGRVEDVEQQPTKRVEVDLERLYIQYSPTDRARLELGQTHTGIIEWNEREHRSRFLQTPIDVPAIATREEQGGAWPLHFVGLWLSGRLGGPLGVEYGAGLGEARGRSRDEIQPLLDEKSSTSHLASLSIAPDALTGWQLGATEYGGEIPAPEGAMHESDITLFTSYVRGGAEVRGEWAQMHHRRFSDDRRFGTRGWYALASWRARGRWKPFRPYLLLDRLDVADGESYLSEVHDQKAWAAGIRWDATRWLAVKSDYRAQLSPNGTHEHLVRLQFAVSF